MLYHGFYVKITPLKNIQRERKDGSISDCNGFQIEIFSNQSEEVTVDVRYYNSHLMKKPYKMWSMLTNKLYICS